MVTLSGVTFITLGYSDEYYQGNSAVDGDELEASGAAPTKPKGEIPPMWCVVFLFIIPFLRAGNSILMR